jgi:hypothetical protein
MFIGLEYTSVNTWLNECSILQQLDTFVLYPAQAQSSGDYIGRFHSNETINYSNVT